MSFPNPKPGRPLSDEVVEEVRGFYCSDDISRVMAGKKDFIIVREGGAKKEVQKGLVFCNVKEAYCAFKQAQLQLQIGFSTFASLRPKHCVFAGATKIHSVCVCSIQQNFKMMVEAVRLSRLMRDLTSLLFALFPFTITKTS